MLFNQDFPPHYLILLIFLPNNLDVWDREDDFSYSWRRQDFCIAAFVLMNISSKNRNKRETPVSN